MNTACSKMNTSRALIQKYWSEKFAKTFWDHSKNTHRERELPKQMENRAWRTNELQKISNPFTSQVRLQKHTGQCEKRSTAEKREKSAKKSARETQRPK